MAWLTAPTRETEQGSAALPRASSEGPLARPGSLDASHRSEAGGTSRSGDWGQRHPSRFSGEYPILDSARVFGSHSAGRRPAPLHPLRQSRHGPRQDEGTAVAARDSTTLSAWSEVTAQVAFSAPLRPGYNAGMSSILPALAVGFAACCLWLTVRIINRRERWAKRTLAAILSLLALYPFSYGPARWLYLKTGAPEWAWSVIDPIFGPVWWARESGPAWLREGLADYDGWWIDLALNRWAGYVATPDVPADTNAHEKRAGR